MADVETPVQVGFSEFIARLMSEVFDSVINSQVDQEERYAQILASAALTEQDYADQYLTQEEVEARTAILFPPRAEVEKDKGKPSSVYAGSPYLVDKKTKKESPPVFDILGITIKKENLVKDGDSKVLAQSAVDIVYERIGLELAGQHLDIARQIISRGLPRVVVDSGKINGKLTFHLTESSQGHDSSPLPGEVETAAVSERSAISKTALGTRDVKGIFTLPKARILPNIRMMVKQADDTSPQSSQVKANVYGEVEITFKTIT